MSRLDLKAFNSDISNGALSAKELPKRIKILSWGKNDTTDGPVYLNEQSMRVFDTMQKSAGRDKDVALDFDHCTVSGSKEWQPGQPKSIAAYGDPEIIKGDGLYLKDLEWTPMGEESARNYKDLSPACILDENNVVKGLHSAALTPNGAVYNLKFYSADGFNSMIKKMSVNDNGAGTANKVVVKAVDEYNKDGANPSLNKHGSSFSLVTHPSSVDDGLFGANDENALTEIENLEKHEINEIEHDENNPDCECADCQSSKLKISTDDKPVDNGTKVKPMSADKIDSLEKRTIDAKVGAVDNSNKTIPAYQAQPPQYSDMNETIKAMAALVQLENESDVQKVLDAFLAKFRANNPEYPEQITKKENTDQGGLKQFSAEFKKLKSEVEQLKALNADEAKRHDEFERAQIFTVASREGKVVPLSADEAKSISISTLRSMVARLPKDVVPMVSKIKALSANNTAGSIKQKAIAALTEKFNASK